MFDVIIVGGGAAGFYAGIQLAHLRPDVSIAIFERGKTVLGKVKVSGGGRCNVTHAEFEPRQLAKNYPRGEKELLGPFHQHMTGDVFAFFEERGVPLKIESDGRVFPKSDSSQSIIECFVHETEKLGITILKNSMVKAFTFSASDQRWQVTTPSKIYTSKILMLTTGSSTKIWEQLREMGHRIVEPTPSLFTFNINDPRLTALQGLSTHAELKVITKRNVDEPTKKLQKATGNLEESGPVLITHWGLSGPAVLRLSAWGARLLNAYKYQFQIQVNWLPEYTSESLLQLLLAIKAQESKKTLHRTKALPIPNRLWVSLLKAVQLESDLKWADTSKNQLQDLAQQLTQGVFTVNGKSTFKEEFVTSGGIDLKEMDFKTFKSKKIPNLYAAGEVLNIDAITGGFNFQNAWTGAFIAASAMAKALDSDKGQH